ncbi:hypothetical protein [Zooshikella sp. RANM57]|uniref:hypothetical protein n=1 Tax=Zooshikella sp. RANM57 TaxID=3425863 RepID=UPI003D6F8562
MDMGVFVSFLGVLTVILTALLGGFWKKVNSVIDKQSVEIGKLSDRLVDERIKSAERFVTVDAMEKRLMTAMAPIQVQLERIEKILHDHWPRSRCD